MNWAHLSRPLLVFNKLRNEFVFLTQELTQYLVMPPIYSIYDFSGVFSFNVGTLRS